MADRVFTFPESTDQSVINCFKAIGKRINFSTLNITTSSDTTINGVDISEAIAGDLKFILDKKSALIDHIQLALPGYSIIFRRGTGHLNKITVSYNQQRAPANKISDHMRVEVDLIINKKLKAFDPTLDQLNIEEQQSKLVGFQNATLKRLEELNEDIILKSHEHKNNLEIEYAAKIESHITESDNKYVKKHDELKAEIVEREVALSHREANLINEKQKIDDSNNTHARRSIRREMLAEIAKRQEQFSLTKGTNHLRWPITFVMIILIGITGFLTIYSAIDLNAIIQKDTLDMSKLIIATLKQFIYSISTIGSIVFMIRWMNRWFESHSQAEFSLKKFELDMERASWLVETSLEWNDKKDGMMPEKLLESLTNNLFADEHKIESVQHPADQLASALFGTAKSAKLKLGDSEVDIDTKALNKDKPKATA